MITPKYRIWDKKRNEWYGESDTNVITCYWFSLFGECTMFQSMKFDDLDSIELEYCIGSDMDDVDVYTGDIVSLKESENDWEVVFDSSLLQYVLRCWNITTHFMLRNVKVKGNIHGRLYSL